MCHWSGPRNGKKTKKKKNTLEGFNNRLDDAEKHISKLENRVVEITHGEPEKKIFVKNKDSLRNLMENTKYTNIPLMRFPE